MKTRMIIAFGIAVLEMCSALAPAAIAEHGLFPGGGCGGQAAGYGPYGAYGVNTPYNPYAAPYGAPAYGAQIPGHPAAYGAYGAYGGGYDPYYLQRKRHKNRTRNIILGVAAVALLSQLAR